jgi:hypothetical protein
MMKNENIDESDFALKKIIIKCKNAKRNGKINTEENKTIRKSEKRQEKNKENEMRLTVSRLGCRSHL